MNGFWRVVFFTVSFLILTSVFDGFVYAQCAMCRATLENNVSNGEIGIAGSLNAGILYLFVVPYLLVGFIAYMWYRKSKNNAETQGYSTR